MAEYVDTIILSVDGVDLDEVIIELTETDESKTEAVNTLNRARRAVAIKQGNEMFSLELKVEPIVNSAVPNWNQLKRKRKYFSITKREAGQSITWSGCKISKVTDSRGDGSSTQSVSVTALNRN